MTKGSFYVSHNFFNKFVKAIFYQDRSNILANKHPGFAFDPQESEAKPHKKISLAESPSNVSPGAVGERSTENRTGYSTIDQ